MHDLDRSIIGEARRAHEHVFNKLIELKQHHGREVDLEGMVDSVYVLKDSIKAFEDLCREMRAILELIEKMSCVLYMQRGDFEPVRTEYCTGSPSPSKTVQTPKQGTEEYRELLKYFGIPVDAPFKPHWPTMMARVTEDIKAGKPIPPGCDPDKMVTKYSVTIRSKKPVGDGGEISDPELLKKQYRLMDSLLKTDFTILKSFVYDLRNLQEEQLKRNSEPVKEEAAAVVEEETPF